jgi:chromosome condensin MukBEF MukE localization factor
MSELQHLQEVFDLLRIGRHISPEDEPAFSALVANYDTYAAHFAPLGLKLVRHPREFFYFEPDTVESMTQTLPRIAAFSFVLIDHAANAGKQIEEFLLSEHFFIPKLPHFTLDRYAALLRQVDIEDSAAVRLVLKNMERLGWVKFVGEEEFRFLRPFHRVFDKCLELSRLAAGTLSAKPEVGGEI